jgi:hypothetical protein
MEGICVRSWLGQVIKGFGLQGMHENRGWSRPWNPRKDSLDARLSPLGTGNRERGANLQGLKLRVLELFTVLPITPLVP